MKNLAELKAVRDRMAPQINVRDSGHNTIRVMVGMATCGIAAGANPVKDAFEKEVRKLGLKNVEIIQTGCVGVCRLEPLVEIFAPGEERVTYVNMSPEKVPAIVESHLKNGRPVEKYAIGAGDGSGNPAITSLADTEFYKHQFRIVLRNCGVIDPESIDEYIGAEGYTALGHVLYDMKPQDVIDVIKASGIRGRGGAGFPSGMKWQFTANAASPDGVKFACCNADEGDPGAFMDRAVLEGDPFSVIEAMTIAGYAIGARQGYIYVRAEYPVAIRRLNIAIGQAKEHGLLGDNIFGTDFSFDLQLRLGAGAFVCGEETALMTSIEGKRGEPRPRPPFPAVKGLFERPTLLNNVETYANITWIINNGADAFKAIGTENSTGTKVFALGGKIVNTGLIEVPMGTPLRTIIEDIGGGCPNGRKFKAAQTGGPSGGCIPESLIDTQIDYDSLAKIGSIMGSGGLIVMDEDNCMVDIAKFFLDFTVDESCGKCVPCRIGTKRMYEILTRITKGQGKPEDLDIIEELAAHLQISSLCALGQTAPNPVVSTIKHFRDEYEAHIKDKRCPAGTCQALLRYEILMDKCIGCTICARNCPVDAITGTVKKPHVIDQNTCIKCGVCMTNCKFGAIIKH